MVTTPAAASAGAAQGPAASVPCELRKRLARAVLMRKQASPGPLQLPASWLRRAIFCSSPASSSLAVCSLGSAGWEEGGPKESFSEKQQCCFTLVCVGKSYCISWGHLIKLFNKEQF